MGDDIRAHPPLDRKPLDYKLHAIPDKPIGAFPLFENVHPLGAPDGPNRGGILVWLFAHGDQILRGRYRT